MPECRDLPTHWSLPPVVEDLERLGLIPVVDDILAPGQTGDADAVVSLSLERGESDAAIGPVDVLDVPEQHLDLDDPTRRPCLVVGVLDPVRKVDAPPRRIPANLAGTRRS